MLFLLISGAQYLSGAHIFFRDVKEMNLLYAASIRNIWSLTVQVSGFYF